MSREGKKGTQELFRFEFLGSKWFIRGLNSNGDFCYAMLKTFYLSPKPMLLDFCPVDQQFKVIYYRGYSLVFNFVRADGVSSDFSNIYVIIFVNNICILTRFNNNINSKNNTVFTNERSCVMT